jgi:anti-sigma regulatory factor (Ser/Thr protein kinase)
VLILQRSAPTPSYVFSAVPITAPIARAVVDRQIAALDMNDERRFGVLVALGEAIANAVEHAYCSSSPGLIALEFANEACRLVMTVEDFGCWRPFVPRYERGRGFELMRAFMDSVQIMSTPQSTKVILTTKLDS